MKPEFSLWLEFEQWATEGPEGTPFEPKSDFFNAKVTLSAGEKYSLNVWTFAYFDACRRECAETGEHIGGRYLPAPDLFVTWLDRSHIEEVIADMLVRGGLNEQWRVRDED